MNIKLGLLILSIIFFYTHQSEHCDDQTFSTGKETLCRSYDAGDGDHCQLIDQKCEAVYTTCKGDSKTCGTVILVDSNNNLITDSKCKYTSSCQRVLKECSDFDANHCRDLNDAQATPTHRRCGVINNKCVEYKDECKDAEQSICDENIPEDYQENYCKWGHEKDGDADSCLTKERTCKDKYVKGLECASLDVNEDDKDKKTCIFHPTDKKCSENYISCDKADNKDACISTIPLDDDKIIRADYQCVWEKEDDKATKETCWPKRVVYQYPSCETPENNDEFEMSEEICKSIQLTIPGHCTYKKDGDKPHCTTVKKTCSEWDLTLIEDICVNKGPDFTKKCILSNGDCIEKKEEAESQQPQGSPTTNDNGEENQTSDENKLKTKMILAFLCLFFL